MATLVRAALAATGLCMLAACGGGGGGGSSLGPNPPPGGGSGGTYTSGVFQPSSSLAAQCVAPRAGTSDRPGTAFTEKMFLRSWTNELYLWYREVPDENPGSLPVEDYFERLKTPLQTPSGRPKDQFHFTFPSEVWEALSQGGVEVGYGAEWMILQGSQGQPRVIVAFVEPGTPATGPANLARGVEVLIADGVTLANATTDANFATLNAAFFPEAEGESHTFTVKEAGGPATREITMISAEITRTPVRTFPPIDASGIPVGYLLFNDHIATSEPALIAAVEQLADDNVQDLILDLRYNGGGFLDIASQLAYMIAGGARTTGQPFEQLVFNDKNPNLNPVTRQPLTPTPFHTTTVGIDDNTTPGTPLPTLNLGKVYVITSSSTCSASESIINGLRGVGVEVYQIGSTTCGKPYGFYPQENCGTTYFSIQFQGLNAQSFGDYPDGFAPQNQGGASSVKLPGCSVSDDFEHQLGDPDEARLKAALQFRASGNTTCPAASGFAPGAQLKAGAPLSAADGVMLRSPLRENRILRQ